MQQIIKVSVEQATIKTLEQLELTEADSAASALALTIAAQIDVETSGRTMAELAAKLLAVLESLGATPAARAALRKGAAPIVINTNGSLAKLRAD